MSGVMMPILGYLKVTNFNEELDVCNGVANKTLKHILSHHFIRVVGFCPPRLGRKRTPQEAWNAT
jgi:hypothetical protein